MGKSRNRTEWLRILGVVKFVSKFIPNMSAVIAPLRNLIILDVDWHWNPQFNEPLSELKQLLIEAPILSLKGNQQ